MREPQRAEWVAVDDWLHSADDEGDDRGAQGYVALIELLRRIEQERPEWQKDALCLEYPEVEFFTTHGQSTKPAKEVCSRCLVTDACLDYAVNNDIRHGVWAGVTGKRLDEIRKSSGDAPADRRRRRPE